MPCDYQQISGSGSSSPVSLIPVCFYEADSLPKCLHYNVTIKRNCPPFFLRLNSGWLLDQKLGWRVSLILNQPNRALKKTWPRTPGTEKSGILCLVNSTNPIPPLRSGTLWLVSVCNSNQTWPHSTQSYSVFWIIPDLCIRTIKKRVCLVTPQTPLLPRRSAHSTHWNWDESHWKSRNTHALVKSSLPDTIPKIFNGTWWLSE